MKCSKAGILFLLAAALLAAAISCCLPGTDFRVYATDLQPSVIASGPFGSGTEPTELVRYTLYRDGTMEITGTGATFSCGWDGSGQPFKEYREQIRYLVIGEGITQIRKGAFAFLPNLETVRFPSTVTVLHNNCFMGSFADSVTSFTVPASVTQVGGFLAGTCQGSGASIGEIIFENPNTVFDPNATPINGTAGSSGLRLYSHGAENAVSAYAQTIGCAYVNLDTYFTGSANGLTYELNGSVLTLCPNGENAYITASEQPWLDHTEATEITELILEDGFTAIGDYAFAGYSALTCVTVGDGLQTLGDGAFCADSQGTLTVKLPYSLKTLGSGIFAGRSNVCARVYYGSAAATLSEPNVQLKTIRRMNLLLIGNSYSHDAVNFSFDVTGSQLYDMLRSMLGEDAEITVTAAYSSAATMAWHATQAEKGAVEYSIYSIGTRYPQWTGSENMSADQILAWKDWDAVVLQPYGEEAFSGINDPIRPGEEAEKFGTLEAASEYMLDYVALRVPKAKIYYFMIWPRTRELKLNAGLELYAPMIALTPGVMDYAGPATGSGFADVIPAGTALQFARSTYFALLSHNPDTYLSGTPAQTDDPQIGLQRDTGHVTYCIGRYIVSRTLAETVVPAEMRVPDYTLPGIWDSQAIGKLPGEYTVVAGLAVDSALASWHRSENRLEVTGIDGYQTDPAVLAGNTLSSQTLHLEGSLEAGQVAATLLDRILSSLGTDFSVERITVPDNMSLLPGIAYTADVTVRFGYTTVTASVPFSLELPVYTATVIPPSCTEDGYTHYVFSDGTESRSDYTDATGHSYVNCLCQTCGEPLRELRPNADGTYGYYVGGTPTDSYTGFFDNGFALWYVESGIIRLNYRGLVTVDGARYYIENGHLSGYTGLKKLEGTWLYLASGKVDTDFAGLVPHNGILVYAENGEVNFSKTDVMEYENQLYYIRYGLLAGTFNGLVKGSDGIWRYMENGVFTGTYTSLAKNSAGWWYVRDSLIDTSFTGLAAYAQGLWYADNGFVNTTFTGLVKHNGNYWYIRYGKAMENYTGIVPHSGSLYYVRDGKADFTYTGSYTDGNGTSYSIVKGVATAV